VPQSELRRFIAVCLNDGRPAAIDLAREGLRRYRRRSLDLL
jgi:hypothetical protein